MLHKWRKRLFAAAAVVAVAGLLASCAGGAPSPTPTATPPPTQPVTYANPDLLVDAGWLSQNLSDAGIRIVDARSAADYKAGHIPGAVSLPVEATFDPADVKKGDVGPAAQLEKVFGERGISGNTRVIVYDAGKDTKAARLFWTLEYAGHSSVAVLNGGFKKWQADKLAVATEESKAAPATFTARVDYYLLATKADVLAKLSTQGGPVAGVAIVDTRTPAEYRGEDLRAKRGGHIPGAVNVDWVNQFTADDAPVLKPAAELEKMYQDLGVTRDKEVYVY